MKKLNRLSLFLLPIVVFFTNFPVIRLGETDSMYLEISLPEIWLILFAIVSLPNLGKLIKFFTPKKLILVALFPLYAFGSVFWSGNPFRAVLTAGLLTLIIFAALNTLYLLKDDGILRHKLLQVLIITSAVVSVFCWAQCLLDLAGVSRADSLMCAGCSYTSFGFPHPNGFTLEPQFMGGLLIAPALLSFYLAFATKTNHKRAYFLLAGFFSTTLFLTFSRGAIYSFIVAIIFLAISLSFAKKSKKPLLIFPAVLAAFMITLTAQGTMSVISPTSDNFISGTTKALHHLTLGHLDLRPTEENSIENPEQSPDDEAGTESGQSEQPEQSSGPTSPSSSYNGYVSESTDVRVNFTNLALEAATSDPKILIFGSGLGSAGTILNEKFPDKVGTRKQIVQNEYASLLLELGLIGIGLAVVMIAGYMRCASNACITAVIIAYALTLFFFSGLPNAFHIYLIPPLLVGIFWDEIVHPRKHLAQPRVRRTGRK
ncbi:O-antigen ligase family protein [Candidatus Saccharibacteria bacterium]|nr:O-antigen ligase family protein [Candidatus Saccharibacteria bacterium]